MTQCRAVARPRSHVISSPLAVALLLAAGFWILDLAVLRAGVPDPLDDTWEYGVAARHLVAGDGYRTSVIHPPLWTLRDSALTVPVLIHGPLIPALIAPLTLALGDRAIDSIAWIGAIFATLTLIPLVRLARRLFDDHVAIGAAMLVTLSPSMIRAVNHDPALAIGAFFFTLALDLAWRPESRPLAAGIAIGVASLIRPEMILAGGMLVLFADPRARWPLALGLIACVSPWWIHQYRATGVPFFNLSSYLLIGYSERYPQLAVLRDFHLPPSAWPAALRDMLPTLPRKWIHWAPRAAKHALLAPSAATGVLALFGLARWVSTSNQARLAKRAALLAAIPIVIMITAEHSPRYVTPFLSLWVIAAACGAREIMALIPALARRRGASIALLAILVLPSTIMELTRSTREARVLEARLESEREALRPLRLSTINARLPGDVKELPPMFSDTPDFVAWSTGRSVVWVTADEYLKLPFPSEPGAGVIPYRGSAEYTWFHDPEGHAGRIGRLPWEAAPR